MCRLLLRRIKWSRTTKCPPKLLGPFGEEPLQSGEKKQMALAMTFFTHGQSRQAVNRRHFQMRGRDALGFGFPPLNGGARRARRHFVMRQGFYTMQVNK